MVEIQNLVETEETPSESESISSPVKLGQVGSLELKWSNYFNPPPTSWGYHNIKPQSQTEFERKIEMAAIQSEQIDPFQPEIEVGSVVNHSDAKLWSNNRHNDIRPRLFDKGENIFYLK